MRRMIEGRSALRAFSKANVEARVESRVGAGGGVALGFGIAILMMAATVHLGALPAQAASGIPRSDRPDAAYVYFISPSDGETVTSPVTVRFGLGEMGVAPAGTNKDGTGHHHLVIDAELPPVDLPVPSSENYRHFGAGQTEVSLDLSPGEHTLQLLLADHIHMPHDPPVASKRITIRVKAKE